MCQKSHAYQYYYFVHTSSTTGSTNLPNVNPCPTLSRWILECDGTEYVLPFVVGVSVFFGASLQLYKWTKRTNAGEALQAMLIKQTTLNLSFINYLQVL